MVSTARLFVVGAGVLMLGSLSYFAVNYGIAGDAAVSAAGQLGRMNRSSDVASAGWGKDALRRAVAEVPGDPTANEVLAIGLMRDTNDLGQLTEARERFVSAIERRPGSGYTWASLAAVKYRLGETDDAFETAMVNAMRLAPYEPEVQRDVVDYGLAVMDEVKPETRAAIDRALAVGMKRNAPEILQISARRGKLGAACRHLDGVPRPAESKWTQLCQSMEATS
jgi:hypothetical protein